MHRPSASDDERNSILSTARGDQLDVSRRSSGAHRRVIILLATLLLANPVIVFLVTHSVVLACLIPVGCLAATQLLAFRPRGTLVFAYAFNAIAVLSIFAHAEVILVYGFPDYVIENLYTIEDGYYFNRPFLEQTFNDKEYDVRYRTNVQGFRIGQVQDPTQSYTNADWLVIGDSFTQGAQVDFSQLYTTLLTERFSHKIIINAGISGLGLGHEYNYFTQAGYRLAPDVVILQLCSFNDLMNVEPTLVGFTDRLMTHSAFLRLLLADFKFRNPAALPLGRWTEPFHPDPQSNADFNIFYNATSPTKKHDLETFERYLVKLRDAVQSHGARLVVVLIPTKEQVVPRFLAEVLREFSINASDLHMRRPNEFLAGLARKWNIDVLDLLPAFQATGANPFFEYDEHLSPVGHRVMADALAEHLQAIAGPTRAQLLSTDLMPERYPVVSQDGSLITYQGLRDRNMELFVATADLHERRQLTFNNVDESHPTLSKDNSQILFTEGSAESHPTEVVIMNLDGSQRRVLTAEPNVFGAIPSFSRSNLEIAYAEWTEAASGTLSTPRITVVDVLSGAKRYLTPADRESWRPVFAPDGTHVYYISKVGDQFDLYAYNLSNATERRLTDTQFDEWDPQVSPDGSQLVYAAHADNNWDLFVIEMTTGKTRRLTSTKGDEWDPSITPDGASIIFAGRFGLREALFRMPISP